MTIGAEKFRVFEDSTTQVPLLINQNILNLNMNKSELVAEIQSNLEGSSKAEAEKALAAVLSAIKTAVKKAGKEVKLRDPASKDAVAIQLVGFGSFTVTKRAARSGINPLTKEPLKIKASKAVKFKAGAGLKDVL